MITKLQKGKDLRVSDGYLYRHTSFASKATWNFFKYKRVNIAY